LGKVSQSVVRQFLTLNQNKRPWSLGRVDTDTASAADRKLLKKTLEAIKDVESYERDILLPLAQQRLEIDLDDGVKVNYPKSGKALTKVAGLS
jgi:hypothetical protein